MVLKLTKLEYQKSGRSLYFSETVFLAKIFQELMVFGHFGPSPMLHVSGIVTRIFHFDNNFQIVLLNLFMLPF